MVDNSGFAAGGGLEQTVSLEAGENMSIGDNWFLGVDGKAYKLRSDLLGANTIYSFYPNLSNLTWLVFVDPSVNKMVWLGRSGIDSSFGAGIVSVNSSTGELTINAYTDSGGTLNGALSSTGGFLKLSSNKLLVYTKSGATLESFIVDYSGTTPVFGGKRSVTTTNWTSTGSSGYDICYDSVNDKILYAFGENIGSYRVMCLVGTISGSSLTWGSVETIDGTTYTTSSQVGKMLFDTVEEKFIVPFVVRPSGDSIIYACSVDTSGASISVGGLNTILSDTSSGSSKFLDSQTGYCFHKLPNGQFLATSYFDYTNAKAYALVLKINTGASTISATSVELRDNGSNISFNRAIPLISVGTSGDFLVGVSYSSTDYIYKLNYDGASLSNEGLLDSGNVNTIGSNIFNTTGSVVLQDYKRSVGGDTFNSVQVSDYSVSDTPLGFYDIEPMQITLPYLDNGKIGNGLGNYIKCVNGVAIIARSNSYSPVLITDDGKIMGIKPLGAASQAITSGQTYKFTVKAAKQGNKPINFTGANLKPPSSYYMSGDSLNWYASTNNDESFDNEYLGYCLTDDVLIINSSSSKET